MSFKHTLVNWFIQKRSSNLKAYRERPLDLQNQTLSYLIRKAQNTVWGKVHQYLNVKTTLDYKSVVSLQSYDDLKPYIQRMIEGEGNVLWDSPVRWFAKSSGTTNDKSKFIPVSREALQHCHYQAGFDTMAVYCQNYPKSRVFSGKGIILGGSHQVSTLHQGIRYGDLSAVLLQNLPKLGRYLSSIDLSIALMDEWESKIQRLSEYYISKDVTSISGVPTWTMVLIKKVFELTQADNLRDIWPNLELFIHGGVSFEPYRYPFQKLIPSPNMHYWQTYNASEGFFGLQDRAESDDMLLMLDYGIFYEFLPLDQLHQPHPKTLQLDEVQKGVNYALVISTNAGLWRYLIGDTIQFTHLNPFRIKISGRTKHFLNVFGEEVMVDNTDRALSKTCAKHEVKMVEYTVAPIFLTDEQRGGHEWVIAFEKEPINLAQFTEDLDQNLQALNSDYEAKRYKSIALQKPKIHAVAPHTFYQWFKEKGKLGGQHKVPRLYNSRKYLEEILEFVDSF